MNTQITLSSTFYRFRLNFRARIIFDYLLMLWYHASLLYVHGCYFQNSSKCAVHVLFGSSCFVFQSQCLQMFAMNVSSQYM